MLLAIAGNCLRIDIHLDSEHLHRVGSEVRMGYHLHLIAVIWDVDALANVIALWISARERAEDTNDAK